MRFIGKLKTWNDERGFGFISPVAGGQDIFMHVSELPSGFRPSPDAALTFEVSLNAQGKKKAVRVRLGTLPAAPTAKIERTSERRRTASSSGGGFTKFVLALVILGAAWAAYMRYMGPERSASPRLQEQQKRAADLGVPIPKKEVFSCDGRMHCSQMSSCEEAKFFLKNCPGTKMDGDNDGIPCEQDLCNGIR